MLDLNHLRVFERVAALGSFAAASRSLGMPTSSVSRCVAQLEGALDARLLQRTTRRLSLTPAGRTLLESCGEPLAKLRETADHVAAANGRPLGLLRVRAGIGFGINVLSDLLPAFLERCPDVRVSLDLTSRLGDIVGDEVDVALQLGPLPDSTLISVKLGSMARRLCAAPAYLRRRGEPRSVAELAGHDTIEMPRGDGRARRWSFSRGGEAQHVDLEPRVVVNEALTILRLVRGGAGLGVISAYLCDPEFASGRLVRLLADWEVPPVDVHLVFPSGQHLAPRVRAFVDFMKRSARPGESWLGGSGEGPAALPTGKNSP